MFSAADLGAQLAQVGDALLQRDADRARRVVDDHVVDRVEDRLGDGAEVLDLVGGHALARAGVDVDHGPALVDDPPRLGGVLLGRVGIAGHWSRLAIAPEIEQVMMTGSVRDISWQSAVRSWQGRDPARGCLLWP